MGQPYLRFALVFASLAQLSIVKSSPAPPRRNQKLSLSDCPVMSPTLKSVHQNSPVQVQFTNQAGVEVELTWVNFQGQEINPDILSPTSSVSHNTHVGHAFRVRYASNKDVIAEFSIAKSGLLSIWPCGEPPAQELTSPGRDKEFENLVHDQSAPCTGPSGSWSCARCLSDEETKARNPRDYGFWEGEHDDQHRVGQTWDNGYGEDALPYIPILSQGPGWMKMSMTDKLKSELISWFNRSKDQVIIEPQIGGGYTNNHIIHNGKLELDGNHEQMNNIISEMKQVLQWWTNRLLRHTATYGVRIYHRGSMLVDHVDRSDTHLASAVLQIAQEVDENGGWPIEAVGPDKKVCEVYLQPGEMLLYEGARIFHGRPMRLNGTNFANAFTHFAPIGWKDVEHAKWEAEFNKNSLAKEEL